MFAVGHARLFIHFVNSLYKLRRNPSLDMVPYCLRVTTIVLCILFSSCSLHAQITAITNGTATPMSGGHEYIRFLDETVNPSNGSVSLRIKLPTAPGRGLNYSYGFNYNSSLTYIISNAPNSTALAVTANNGNNWGGWTLAVPELDGVQTSQTVYDDFGNVTFNGCRRLGSFVFRDLNGEQHSLNALNAGLDTGSGSTNPCGSDQSDIRFSGDSSVQATMPTADQVVIADSHGIIYTFNIGYPSDGGFSVPVSLIEDSNGNEITGQSVDTLGRTFGSDISTSFTFGNTPSHFSLGTQNLVSNPSQLQGCGPAGGGLPSTFQQIKTITLSNGTSYVFEYDPTYGFINKVTYPSGAFVKYDWGLVPLSDAAYYTWQTLVGGGTNDTPVIYDGGNCSELYDWPALQHRYVSFDGSNIAQQQDFTYSNDLHATGSVSYQKSTTVVSKDLIRGSQTSKVYSYFILDPIPAFYYSLPPYQESSVITKDGTGKTIMSSAESWYDDRHKASEITTLEDGSTSEIDYSYYCPAFQATCGPVVGSGGAVPVLPYETDYYDFGAGSHGSLLKKSVSTYANFASNPLFQVPPTSSNPNPTQVPIILDRPSQVTVYDGQGNPVASSVYCYDQQATQNLVGVIQHDDTTYSSIFNVRGNLTQQLDWLSSPGATSPLIAPSNCGASGSSSSVYSRLFTYDATGQVTSETDPRGHTTQFAYTDNYITGSSSQNTNAYLTSVTLPMVNGMSEHMTYGYDFSSGLLKQMTDANSQTTTYSYSDPLLRLTDQYDPSSTQNSGSQPHTHYAYIDGASTSATITNPIGISSSIAYDGVGHVTRTTSHFADPTYVDSTYDGMGQLYTQSNPYRSTTDSSYAFTTYTYDALGRLISKQNGGDRTSYTWNYIGSSVRAVDENGVSTTRTSDALGRLLSVIEPGSLNTTYGYDALNNLTRVVQSGSDETPRVRAFLYDSMSRLVSATNPETGTICYGLWSGDSVGRGICQNGYDPNGNLVAKTDSRGVTTNYRYDALNRLIRKQYNDGTLPAAFGYDGNDENGNPFSQSGFQSLNAVGRLSVITNQSNAGQAYSYDSMGRVTGENIFLPSVNAWSTLASAKYDLAGNMTDLWYPSGRHIQQGWDGAGRLSSSNLVDITGVSQSQSYLGSLLYNPDGSPGTMTVGNGVQQTLTENNRLQTESLMVNSPSSGVLLSHSYCYANCSTGGIANNGNIWGITDNLNSALTQGFTYDGLNRISSFSLGGTLTQQYGIDSFGNLTGTMGVHYISCFDPATNRMNNGVCTPTVVSGSLPPSLVYDNAGNLTQDSDPNGLPRTYTYDAENRLTGISMTGNPAFETYIYGADGARVNKTTTASGGFTEYVNFNGQTIAEKDQNGTWTDYIYGNGTKIAKTTTSEPVFHMWGNDCDPSSCGGQFAIMSYSPPAQTRLLQKGDTFQYMQANSGPAACGGMTLVFSDNSWTNFITADQNGVITNFDTQAGWHKRIFSLDAFVGLSITHEYFINEQCGLQGAWDMRYSDISVTGTDGTVWPIFNQNSSFNVGVNYTTGITGVGVEVDQRAASEVDTNTGLADLNTTFYFDDHLGSAQMEFASAGWPLSSSQFAPYGTQINADGAANHYKFTGKERDAESGLDYFGARYYGSSMGRFMSPDPLNLTEERLRNPSNTLNKYAYAANNPLKFVDPDGEDVTYFYDQGGIAGHAVLFAYNQQTGDSAIESFGPVVHAPIASGESMFDMSSVHSADDLRSTYAALTIQTSPELAQQVIAYIRANPDPSTWTAIGPNCSTQCSKILQKFKLEMSHRLRNPGLRPKLLWNDLRQQYNPNAPAKPQNGTDYGQPRTDMFNAMWLSLPQAPPDNSTVTTSQHDNGPCGGDGQPKCQ